MKIGKRAAAQDETRQGNGLGRNGTSVSGCGGGCGGYGREKEKKAIVERVRQPCDEKK